MWAQRILGMLVAGKQTMGRGRRTTETLRQAQGDNLQKVGGLNEERRQAGRSIGSAQSPELRPSGVGTPRRRLGAALAPRLTISGSDQQAGRQVRSVFAKATTRLRRLQRLAKRPGWINDNRGPL